jgi:hypothetical protein
MDTVNWEKWDSVWNVDSDSPIIRHFLDEVHNSDAKEIHYHDPEVSNDQQNELLRVLDDSPGDWDQFLLYRTHTEFHMGYEKNQKDGRKLFKLIEGYPGATQLPPLYILMKED